MNKLRKMELKHELKNWVVYLSCVIFFPLLFLTLLLLSFTIIKSFFLLIPSVIGFIVYILADVKFLCYYSEKRAINYWEKYKDLKDNPIG